ncbi:MAG: ParB-like protein [Aestuariivirga sp.]
MTVQSIDVKALRPTQIAVGMKLVKAKRKGPRARERKPQELVQFIIDNPIRVVAGPAKFLFVVDHHHLALALLDEGFETAPVVVLEDFSTLAMAEFWKQMEAKGWVYPVDGKGRKWPLRNIPRKVKDLEDDPYRSLAGLVRESGRFVKVQTPYAEFLWAEFYRTRIEPKLVKKDFSKALAQAKRLAASPDAANLPGYAPQSVAKVSNKKNNG